MNAIKRGLKLLGTKSGIEKDVIKLLCSPDMIVPPGKLTSPLLLSMKDSELNVKPNTKAFLDSMRNVKRWEDAAKILTVAHEVLYSDSSVFAQEFAATSFQNLLDLPNNKEEFKHFVRSGLMKYYYRYLKKLAESHFSLRKCRNYTSSDFSSQLPKNDGQMILQYTQLKELVIFLAKVEDFFVSSTELQGIPIMQTVGELMLRDCIELYNLMSKFISKTIVTVFDLPDETALLLDGVYSDLIRLNKPVAAFYDLKRTFTGKIPVKDPIYYHFDKDFNTKEELHMNSLRKRNKDHAQIQAKFSLNVSEKRSDYEDIAYDGELRIDYIPESERKDDYETENGYKNGKDMDADKKYNLEREGLLTNEDKDYFDEETHQLENDGRKHQQKKSVASLTHILISPKQINGSAKLIQFSKIDNHDL